MGRSPHDSPPPPAQPPGQFPMDADVWQEVIVRLRLAPQHVCLVEQLLQGKRDKQIARALGIKLPTLRTYFRRVFDRVEVDDRVGLILKIFRVAHELDQHP